MRGREPIEKDLNTGVGAKKGKAIKTVLGEWVVWFGRSCNIVIIDNNNWVNPFLEENIQFYDCVFITVTGIYTGSVYKDYGLLKNGFPAESVVNGSVSLVKTHEWGPMGRQRFHRAVLLIRAPGPAILAEFNRQSGGHVGFASPERYRRNKGRCKPAFIFLSIKRE